jgi:hypothetical protein
MTHLLIPSHLAGFMTQVVQGFNVDRVCRCKICCVVVEATLWIMSSEHAWFRCPACGKVYGPWIGMP